MPKIKSRKPASNFILWLTAFCWLGAFDIAHAETIALRLRNGDRVTGSILSENATHLILSNAWTKELTIPLSQIEKRESVQAEPAPRPISAPTNATAVAKIIPPTTPAIKPKPPQAWHGEAQIGADLTFSAKDRQLYYGRFKLIYARDLPLGSGVLHKFKTALDYNATYGLTEGILSDNRMDGTIKTDFDLNKRVFVYNAAGAGYDEIRKIDARYEVGPGVGYHLLTRSNLVWNTELGANYEARYFTNQKTDERFFIRVAEDLNWKFSKKLSFDEKFEFFPRVEDPSQYRYRLESNLKYL